MSAMGTSVATPCSGTWPGLGSSWGTAPSLMPFLAPSQVWTQVLTHVLIMMSPACGEKTTPTTQDHSAGLVYLSALAAAVSLLCCCTSPATGNMSSKSTVKTLNPAGFPYMSATAAAAGAAAAFAVLLLYIASYRQHEQQVDCPAGFPYMSATAAAAAGAAAVSLLCCCTMPALQASTKHLCNDML